MFRIKLNINHLTTTNLSKTSCSQTILYSFLQNEGIQEMNDYKINSRDVLCKTEALLNTEHSRYKITVQVAHRAKRRKYEDIDIIDDPLIKPVIRAIVEMVDEITQPEIIID